MAASFYGFAYGSALYGAGPQPAVPAGEVPNTGAPPFEGDAFLVSTLDGGDVVFVAGEPVRSGGIEGSFYLSMFGANEEDTGAADDRLQWWGNYLDGPDTSKQYRGQTGRLLASLPMTTANLVVVSAAMELDTAWAIELGLADSIIASTVIESPFRVALQLDVVGPSGEGSFIFRENWGALA